MFIDTNNIYIVLRVLRFIDKSLEAYGVCERLINLKLTGYDVWGLSKYVEDDCGFGMF